MDTEHNRVAGVTVEKSPVGMEASHRLMDGERCNRDKGRELSFGLFVHDARRSCDEPATDRLRAHANRNSHIAIAVFDEVSL